jgi:hypothetical protein
MEGQMANRGVDDAQLVLLTMRSRGEQAAGKDAFPVVRFAWFKDRLMSVAPPPEEVRAGQMAQRHISPFAVLGVPLLWSVRLHDFSRRVRALFYIDRRDDKARLLSHPGAHGIVHPAR